MRFFLRYVAPVLAILWLVQVRPWAAAVAVLLCVIRSAFKSHVFSTMFAHLLYDILKSCAGLIFGRVRWLLGRGIPRLSRGAVAVGQRYGGP